MKNRPEEQRQRQQPKVRDSRNAWPYPLVTEIRHEGSPDWVEISPEHAEELRNVLPPIGIYGGFMVPEPAAHTDDGDPICLAVIRLPNGRYVVRDWPRRTRHDAQQAAILADALTLSFDYQTEPAP